MSFLKMSSFKDKIKLDGNEIIIALSSGKNAKIPIQSLKDFFSVPLATVFRGIATPTTNPGVQTEPSFWIALNPGFYENFNNLEVLQSSFAVLFWDGSEWIISQTPLSLSYGVELSNNQIVGSTFFDDAFSYLDFDAYYFNKINYNYDRYVKEIKMVKSVDGEVTFVFGKIESNIFIERKSITIDLPANISGATFPIDAILYAGEYIAIKTPSFGMCWKTVVGGNLFTTTNGYDTQVIKQPNKDLAIEVSFYDFIETGFTRIEDTNELRVQLTELNDRITPEYLQVGNKGGFATISDAINTIKTLAGIKIIVIHPGVYEEAVDLVNVSYNLQIKMVAAINGTVTIIKRTGDYSYPPLYVNIRAYFQGIKFVSNQELGLANPSSYAVHSDFGPGIGLIEYFNCEFINDVENAQAYGAGSWQGHTLRFRNCVFRKNNTITNGGSMYWHNKVANGITNQRLEMLFCEIYSQGGATLQLHDANQTNGGNTNPALSQASVLFVGNTFKSGDLTPNASFLRQEVVRIAGALVGNIFLDEASHGNNITDLNF